MSIQGDSGSHCWLPREPELHGDILKDGMFDLDGQATILVKDYDPYPNWRLVQDHPQLEDSSASSPSDAGVIVTLQTCDRQDLWRLEIRERVKQLTYVRPLRCKVDWIQITELKISLQNHGMNYRRNLILVTAALLADKALFALDLVDTEDHSRKMLASDCLLLADAMHCWRFWTRWKNLYTWQSSMAMGNLPWSTFEIKMTCCLCSTRSPCSPVKTVLSLLIFTSTQETPVWVRPSCKTPRCLNWTIAYVSIKLQQGTLHQTCGRTLILECNSHFLPLIYRISKRLGQICSVESSATQQTGKSIRVSPRRHLTSIPLSLLYVKSWISMHPVRPCSWTFVLRTKLL